MQKSVIYIFVIIFIALIFLSPLNSQTVRFKKLRTRDNFPIGNVNYIYQDHIGFMWFGTENGLIKYDGSKITSYKFIENDSTSLSNNFVWCIIEDDDNNLWIGTSIGLNKYLPESDRFKRFTVNSKNPSRLANNNINQIYKHEDGNLWIVHFQGIDIFDPENEEFTSLSIPLSNDIPEFLNVRRIYIDHDGIYWIGTVNGLYRYNPSEKNTKFYTYDLKDKNNLSHNNIRFIIEDKKNNLWIGTYGGLNLFNKENEEFINFYHDPKNKNTLVNDQVDWITVTDDNKLWIGTTSGLSLMSKDSITNTYNFTAFKSDPGDINSLSGNSITCMVYDKEGRFWIGSRFGGIDIYDIKIKKFEHFKNVITNPYSLSHNNVSNFAEEDENNIWVATDGGGLNKFNKKNNRFIHYKYDINNSNSIASNKVLSLLIDHENKLWIGYWGGGLDLYDPKTNKFTHFMHDPANKNSLSSNNIFCLYEDKKQNLWIGTWYAGINRMNIKTREITRFPFALDTTENYGITGFTIKAILEDSFGNIWIGSEGAGLECYNYNTNTFKHYVHDNTDSTTISDNSVSFIYEDLKNRLWVGTRGSGLNLFDRNTGKFKHFAVKDGIADNNIYGILEDEQGYLWLSTGNGLTKFLYVDDVENPYVVFRNYNIYDGLQDNQFNQWAYYKDKNGTMYFGGINGFNMFRPEEIIDNKIPPDIIITDLYIFNEKITTQTPNSPLTKSIMETEELKLSYKHSMISFEFTALNYTSPEKNQFEYKLEGFDNDWNYNGNNNSAAYTNLDPGKYVFRVRASNNDDYWNYKGTSLTLIITPPFWETLWFRLFAFLFVILLIYLIYRYRVNKYRTELKVRQEYQIELEKAKNKAEESDKLKSSILANISHEIRTPINGIIGFSDLLHKKKLDEETRNKYIKIIKDRCQDLVLIMDSILKISAIAAGTVKLIPARLNLNSLMIEIHIYFQNKLIITNKDINISINIDPDKVVNIITDENKLKTILNNLLDNALKFTKQGKIELGYLIKNNKEIEFYILDTGIGIPKEKQDEIFELFRQNDSGLTRKYGGLGLGLALCKSYLKIMKGDIWLKSEVNKGSVFYFKIPYEPL